MSKIKSRRMILHVVKNRFSRNFDYLKIVYRKLNRDAFTRKKSVFSQFRSFKNYLPKIKSRCMPLHIVKNRYSCNFDSLKMSPFTIENILSSNLCIKNLSYINSRLRSFKNRLPKIKSRCIPLHVVKNWYFAISIV